MSLIVWEESLATNLRPNWGRYFLDLYEAVARRATCDRGRSGCVIVKDKRIMTTGYVGATAGLPHCDEVGHDMRKVFDSNATSHSLRPNTPRRTKPVYQ